MDRNFGRFELEIFDLKKPTLIRMMTKAKWGVAAKMAGHPASHSSQPVHHVNVSDYFLKFINAEYSHTDIFEVAYGLFRRPGHHYHLRLQ